MFVCMCGCILCLHHTHVRARAGHRLSSFITFHLISLRQGFSLNWKCNCFSGAGGAGSSWDALSLCPTAGFQAGKTMLASCVGARVHTQILIFTHQISPQSHLVFCHNNFNVFFNVIVGRFFFLYSVSIFE